MKPLLIIPGYLFKWNERFMEDLVVYLNTDEQFPVYISYKSGGDVARFKTSEELFKWLNEHVLIPNI